MNKSKSSLNCEVGGYHERKNNKLNINWSPSFEWIMHIAPNKFCQGGLAVIHLVCACMPKFYVSYVQRCIKDFRRYKHAYVKPSTVRLNHLHIFCNGKIERWQGASN